MAKRSRNFAYFSCIFMVLYIHDIVYPHQISIPKKIGGIQIIIKGVISFFVFHKAPPVGQTVH
jgi:hypothetical protein